MINRQHCNFSAFSHLPPRSASQSPHAEAMASLSRVTRETPVQWQNSLPPYLNSASWAHKAKCQTQDKPEVIPCAGLPAQMRAGQDINTAPRNARATLGTHLALEQWQGARDNVWGLPQCCPSQPSCISDQTALAGCGLWPGFQGGAQAQSSAVLPDLSHYCSPSTNFTGQALPSGLYPEKYSNPEAFQTTNLHFKSAPFLSIRR